MKGIGGEGSARSLCPYGHIRPKPIPYFSLHVRTLASGLDWSYSAINKYSVWPRSALLLQLVSSRAAVDFRPDPPFGPGEGSADKKFSSCFLNSYIIQTHFRMKPEEPPPAPAPVARQEAGSQTEVICFRSYQSHSLETGNGFALPLPLPLFLFYRDIFVWLKSRQHNRVKFRLPLPTCKFSKSLQGFESIWDDSSNVIGLLFT